MNEEKQIVKKGTFQRIKDGAYKHSSLILTVSTITSGTGAIIFAVHGTTKAHKIIEQNKHELYNKDGKINKKAVVKRCWKCYIPTAISFVLFIASSITEHVTSENKQKALSKAFMAANTMLGLYENQTKELVGEEKAQEIKESIGQKIIERDHVGDDDPDEINANNELPPGTIKCYDPLIDREFLSDRETIRRAQNDLNELIIRDGWGSLNDFYDFLDMPSVNLGEDLGWDIEHRLDITFGSCVNGKGIPCLTLIYNVMPKRLYEYD